MTITSENNKSLWSVTECRDPAAVGAHCVSRNERPSSNKVFSGLPACNSGSGNYQHCHCAHSKCGTTVHRNAPLTVSGMVFLDAGATNFSQKCDKHRPVVVLVSAFAQLRPQVVPWSIRRRITYTIFRTFRNLPGHPLAEAIVGVYTGTCDVRHGLRAALHCSVTCVTPLERLGELLHPCCNATTGLRGELQDSHHCSGFTRHCACAFGGTFLNASALSHPSTPAFQRLKGANLPGV